MDFGTLLHTASKNDQTSKKEIRYYSTKFQPPKKEPKNKNLSINVKNFLAKKEAEEKQKAEEARRKRDELLALRSQDKKATRRVNVMLKRTKSANQSVIQDAVDRDNTAVTLAGPSQPDEDDYGYVSQEAANFYNKMMEKYSKMPDEPKFNFEKKKVSTNLSSTKDRVKAGLEKEKEDAMMPHRRKRKRREDGDAEEKKEVYEKCEESPKPAKMRPPAPPPMNFAELLKLAEKKQFEPIQIEAKSSKDEERPLTKKQKKEMEREKEWRDRKEGKLPPLPPPAKNSKPQKPELNQPKQAPTSKVPLATEKQRPQQKIPQKSSQPPTVPPQKCSTDVKPNRPLEKPKCTSKPEVKPFVKPQPPKKFPPNDSRPKGPMPAKRTEMPPRKEFPPKDVRRKEAPRKKPMIVKGKFLDDDEYDSEMDDFIDDGPEGEGDYSKYISEIFGYDKSKYRHLDDDVDNMESTFSEQMKEEFISTKIGIMEDLEDIKKEEEEKRRKAIFKKKLKR